MDGHDVEDPPGDAHQEREEPAPVTEEDAQRPPGAADGEARSPEVIVCWATHDQLKAAAVSSASRSPMTREAWGNKLTGLGLQGGFRAYRRTASHPGHGSGVRRRARTPGRRSERHRP